jgi:hypothetical protein
LAALAVGVLGVLALGVGPAHAQDEHFPASGWQVRQIGLGETEWSPAAESAIVDATTVDLTKPDGTTGTSIETADLGLDVAAGTEISVSYALLDGADTVAGAVRLFYYDTADADTLGAAPTGFVAADGPGTLSLTVDVDTTIGTLGLVYDASNPAVGTVRFTNLTVGYTTVLFVAPPELCEWDDTLLADDEKCQPPASPSPSPSPSLAPPASGAGGSDEQLPVTGASLPLLTGAGAALAGLGAGALLLARRLRTTFTAE